MQSRRLLALLFLAWAGCYSPNYGNGQLKCGPNGDCPSGLHCGSDNRCYRPGSGPDMTLPSASPDMSAGVAGMAGVDMAGSTVPPDLAGLSGDMAVIKHQGQTCLASSDCDTGNCVDGYCCDSTCANTCQACNVKGSLGHCSDVAAGGVPVGQRSCNAQTQASCGRDGTCDGAGNCRNWPSGTQCAPGSCDSVSGNFSNPSTCNGAGACVANPGGNCAPYVCANATQCYSTCGDSSACSAGNSCVGNSCGTLPNGRLCNGNAQCSSGNCVDGYCCNSSCNTSSCQACDVPGSLGTCSTVAAGTPHGSRSCTNPGTTCGGSCDGTSATCAYPTASTTCGVACSGNQLVTSSCNGAGGCIAGAPTPCAGNLSCPSGGSACLSSCSGNGDCTPASTYGCNVGNHQCAPFCQLDSSNLDNCICQ